MNRATVLETAKKELGNGESPPNSNKTKYGEWYGGGLNGQKWCAIFVSWVFDHAGIPLGNIQTKNGIHHCQSAYNYYKSKNLLTSDPQPGDIVIYDWEGNGYADHIGIFVKWTNTSQTQLQAYEGNTALGNDSDGGKVMLRTRSRNLVKSFINPGVYGNQQITTVDPVLRKGSRGSQVVLVQKYLFDLGDPVLVDGWYGTQTEKWVREFQTRNAMNATGEADPMTIGALQEAAGDIRVAREKLTSGSYLKLGNSGILVTLIQKQLNKNNPTAAIDVNGIYDAATCDAVKSFQKANGLKQDGVVGPLTLAKLDVTDNR